MALDLTKPVQTRDGRPVRILCTDRKSTLMDKPVVGLVTNKSGSEILDFWSLTGAKGTSIACEGDLVNVPERKSKWMNMYGGELGGFFHSSRQACEESAQRRSSQRTEVVELIFEDGALTSTLIHKAY